MWCSTGCEIFLDQGSKLCLLRWERGVLTPEPLGKSWHRIFNVSLSGAEDAPRSVISNRRDASRVDFRRVMPELPTCLSLLRSYRSPLWYRLPTVGLGHNPQPLSLILGLLTCKMAEGVGVGGWWLKISIRLLKIQWLSVFSGQYWINSVGKDYWSFQLSVKWSSCFVFRGQAQVISSQYIFLF